MHNYVRPLGMTNYRGGPRGTEGSICRAVGVYTSTGGLEKTIINIPDYIVSQVNAQFGQSGIVQKIIYFLFYFEEF